MGAREHTHHAGIPSSWGPIAVAAGLGVVLVAAVGLPAIGVITQLVRSGPAAPPPEASPISWGAFANTFIYTGLIGVLATGLALPAAWVLRRRSALWTALVGVPLLMPSYMAYSGWGLLRGPGSWLGDWLGHRPPWVCIAFDKSLAVIGLSLWAWPLGAFVIGAAARRIPSHLLDALALEPGAWWRRARVIAALLAGSIGASVVLIALVMAGSAIPLHLAQVDTYTIHLWKYMSLTPSMASVWSASVPLLLLAAVAALVIARVASRERPPVSDAGDSAQRPLPRSMLALAALVWLLSVAAPAALFVWHLRWWSSIAAFWKGQSGALQESAVVAAAVGTIIALLALATWAVRAARGRGPAPGATRIVLWSTLAAALVPGILIGAATLAFWNAPFIPRPALDTIAPVILDHVARFGFIGVLGGWWLAGLETPDERGSRLMLAGDGLRGWAALCLRPQAGAIVGIALAGAALSLHEIESTVTLQRAGSTSLAQYILDKLHYNRDEDLCAACINVIGIGFVLAMGSGWLLGRRKPSPS